MRRSTKGEVLFKRVELKVVPPEGHPVKKEIVHAGPGRCFTEKGIDAMLEHAAANVGKEFPHWDFRLVQVAPNAFNFVYAGLRETAEQNSIS
jgi:hypothetical protein